MGVFFFLLPGYQARLGRRYHPYPRLRPSIPPLEDDAESKYIDPQCNEKNSHAELNVAPLLLPRDQHIHVRTLASLRVVSLTLRNLGR